MADLNFACLIGTLGRDAEIKHTRNGGTMITFSVATEHKFPGSDGKSQRATTWHNVKSFSLPDTVSEQLVKGARVRVEGRIDVFKTEDGKVYNSIITDSVRILNAEDGGYTKSADRRESSGRRENRFEASDEDLDDSVPF